MAADGSVYHQIPPAVWAAPGMAQALAVRDIGVIYRILQRYGVAQRRIAALVSRSQSEVSEIIKGRRVETLRVLERICDGLGISGATMGPPSPYEPLTTAGSPDAANAPVCPVGVVHLGRGTQDRDPGRGAGQVRAQRLLCHRSYLAGFLLASCPTAELFLLIDRAGSIDHPAHGSPRHGPGGEAGRGGR
jgi:transcriptional regulator with XRE-family HTH domain